MMVILEALFGRASTRHLETPYRYASVFASHVTGRVIDKGMKPARLPPFKTRSESSTTEDNDTSATSLMALRPLLHRFATLGLVAAFRLASNVVTRIVSVIHSLNHATLDADHQANRLLCSARPPVLRGDVFATNHSPLGASTVVLLSEIECVNDLPSVNASLAHAFARVFRDWQVDVYKALPGYCPWEPG